MHIPVVGSELASRVVERLDAGERLRYAHRDYCGVGLHKDGNIYVYDAVYDGEFETIADVMQQGSSSSERREFSIADDLIHWLSQQTDARFSGEDLDDSFYRGNQRLSIQRLRDFVNGFNPSIEDEYRLPVEPSDAPLRRAARVITWRGAKSQRDKLLSQFREEPITGCIFRKTVVELASPKTAVALRYSEIGTVWVRPQVLVLHVPQSNFFAVVPVKSVPWRYAEFMRGRLGDKVRLAEHWERSKSRD